LQDVKNDEYGIQLRSDRSASQILHLCLDKAVQAYPAIFSEINFPKNSRDFRASYVAMLPEFEAARINHPARTEIARLLAETFQDQLAYHSVDGICELKEHLAHPAKPLLLERLPPNNDPGWQPTLHFLKQDWPDLSSLSQALVSEKIISAGAKEALAWLDEYMGGESCINLSSRKIVVFGASAEMAPTAQFNAAGAEILWLDLTPPTKLAESRFRGGTVQFPADGVNLLTQPAEILATILAFAAGQRLDLCLYAYSPGQAREMRLTAAMNAIVNALPKALIESITLLLSPTTATPLDQIDLSAMTQRKNNRPRWEAVLDGLGLLGSGGGATIKGNLGASRSLVGIQGASYQAAQYLAKLMAAETWAQSAPTDVNEKKLLRVSANTAPITQTRSIAHPVFDAAFIGATALGVQTFTPTQSQTLNGLLAVHDWVHPISPQPGKIRVHGGIHTLPYPMNTALRVAAVIGFVQSPKLLGALFKH
jgi:hypothetical protein